jgi:hypothetical protein
MTLLKPTFFALTLVKSLTTYRFEYLSWPWQLFIGLPLTDEGVLTLLGLIAGILLWNKRKLSISLAVITLIGNFLFAVWMTRSNVAFNQAIFGTPWQYTLPYFSISSICSLVFNGFWIWYLCTSRRVPCLQWLNVLSTDLARRYNIGKPRAVTNEQALDFGPDCLAFRLFDPPENWPLYADDIDLFCERHEKIFSLRRGRAQLDKAPITSS